MAGGEVGGRRRELGDGGGIGRQMANGRGEARDVVAGGNEPKLVCQDAAGDLTVWRTDEKHRAPGGGNSVELAREDETLAAGAQGDEMEIPHCQRFAEAVPGLGWMKGEVGQRLSVGR
jgi:hypothetical protein